MNNSPLPSFQELFGQLDFKKGESARSVYSPAAYLSDLLQLIDDHFEHSDLNERRSDIKQLLLNKENTYDLTPYLSIVNNILETIIEQEIGTEEGDAYSALKNAKFPFNLPFDLEQKKLLRQLHFLKINPIEFYKIFATELDEDVITRYYLVLSEGEYNLVEPLDDENAIKEGYNLNPSSTWEELLDVETFMRTTNLNATQIQELLYGNLSQIARNESGEDERIQAGKLFINAGLGGYAKLDELEENLIFVGDADWKRWLERVNRLVRTAANLDISITDLDMIIRSLCDNHLDKHALRKVALVRYFSAKYDRTIEETCALFGPLNILGQGNEDKPIDLFNRTFNGQLNKLDKKILRQSEFSFKAYQESESFELGKNFLGNTENETLRKRIRKTLNFSNKGLKVIFERFQKQSLKEGDSYQSNLDEDQVLNEVGFSLLYRISSLLSLLDITPQVLLDILDILGADQSIKDYSNFDVLLPGFHLESRSANLYQTLEEGSFSELAWLIQMVCSVSAWMDEYDFSSKELKVILSGERGDDKEKKASSGEATDAKTKADKLSKYEKKLISTFDNLYQQFQSAIPNEVSFYSNGITERTFRVIYDTLKKDPSLVAGRDALVINYEVESAQAFSRKFIRELPKIQVADFHGLGLSDSLLDQLFDQLYFMRYIETDGILLEENFPNDQNDFSLTTDLSVYEEVIFRFQHRLYQIEHDAGRIPVELRFQFSDLGKTNLTEIQKTELEKRLFYNKYIDERNKIVDPSFFADLANLDDFSLTVNFDSLAASVFSFIADKIEKFRAEELKLTADVFQILPLDAFQIKDLIRNLRFNDYLDDQNNIVDKVSLLQCEADDLKLALAFYPHRKEILNEIKQYIKSHKEVSLRLKKENLIPLAEQLAAALVAQNLEEKNYIVDGKLNDESILIFIDPENISQFQLDTYFEGQYTSTVFSRLNEIAQEINKYSFLQSDLQFIDLEDEFEPIADLLHGYGFLENAVISEQYLPYFLNANNQIDLDLEDYEDLGKIVFSILHLKALEIESTCTHIEAVIEKIAQKQEDILYETLKDALGVEETVVKVLADEIILNKNKVEAFILPLQATENTKGEITELPKYQNLNIAYRRMEQFALLASKLELTAEEVHIAFKDQNLVDQFGENIALPDGLSQLDALLEHPDGLVYFFKGDQYWSYSKANYQAVEEAKSLEEISELFSGLTAVDAAFLDKHGVAWLIAGNDIFYLEKGGSDWKLKEEKKLGKLDNKLQNLDRIDATLTNKAGQTFMFFGDQYIKYNGGEFDYVEEGYPLAIKDNWAKDFGTEGLPAIFHDAIGAAFHGKDNKTYFFKGNQFVVSDDLSKVVDIANQWGVPKEQYDGSHPIDAALMINDHFVLFSGKQVLAYSDSLENPDALMDEGFPKLISNCIPGLPEDFNDGIDAAFQGSNDEIYLFKGESSIKLTDDLTVIPGEGVQKNRDRWGRVNNTLRTVEGSSVTGQGQPGGVSAALTGLDGYTYVFSGNQFFRYSKGNYEIVDEGYPKNIADHWGGLNTVDAAFVLDGKTYLFGPAELSEKDKDGNLITNIGPAYVRYSTNEYDQLDDGYPKKVDDNWWNLPFELVQQEQGFSKPDAVFVANDGHTYLFSGKQYIYFEKNERWWSDPQSILDNWAGVPQNFERVEAAFTGKDGKTYLFVGDQFLKYSADDFSKAEGGAPQKVQDKWGVISNNFQDKGNVQAAIYFETMISVESEETGEAVSTEEAVEQSAEPKMELAKLTYLFSGDQYVRYRNEDYSFVEEGYPKKISQLKEEPRFSQIDISLEEGFDAICANQRTLFVFQGTQLYTSADQQHTVYNDAFPAAIQTALLEQGKLFLDDGNGWKHYTGLESEMESSVEIPDLFKEVPGEFKQGLDAVLRGIDNNTYFFKGNVCYNLLLEKAYPLTEEWGRADINLQNDQKIDAIFEGTDRKIYVFSGNQYLTYTLPELEEATEEVIVVPDFIDEYPNLIQDDFGLDNVVLAFVDEGITYFFEAPDEEGKQRCLQIEGVEYLNPEKRSLLTVDFKWWGIPEPYLTEGFDYVDAVLFEEDNMFLICANEFLQYNKATESWSYPKPLERIWREMPYDENDFDTIWTAFTASDKKTYFFSDENFVIYEEGQLVQGVTPVNARWGRTDNNITNNQKIDAAFVFGKNTYLFSGDQYVRYSDVDYEFIDKEYPKPILENLRKEAGFGNLPDNFEETLKERFEKNGALDEVISDGVDLYIFTGNDMHVFASEATHERGAKQLGKIQDNLRDGGGIDAALLTSKGHSLLFSGDQYYRYSGRDYSSMDEGYPKRIASNLKEELEAIQDDIPKVFHDGIDAAFIDQQGTVYLFKGDQYYDSSSDTNPLPLTSRWGKVKNNFDGDTSTYDALFQSPDGYVYAFKGNQFIRYEDFNNEFVDRGYPMVIKDNWGNMPLHFEQSIDGAFMFENKAYLTKGGEYIRYSDHSYKKVDDNSPQTFANRWTRKTDYLLTDIKQITEYKSLVEKYSGKEHSLNDFLSGNPEVHSQSYTILAQILDAEKESIEWLKRNNSFLPQFPESENRFHLEELSNIHRIAQFCAKLKIEPKEMYQDLWLNMFSNNGSATSESHVLEAVKATSIYLHQLNSYKDWEILSRQLRDEFNIMKRDVLVPYVILRENQKLELINSGLEERNQLPLLNSSRDLYGQLLIDVDMDSDAETSKIKEAIAATQLYIHRTLVNMEAGLEDETKRQVFKDRWKWMKNYRVWEANRKVFLYPENYIRPELRQEKTQAFKTFEEDLLQGEMNDALVEQAFRKYLKEYSEVSRLTIAGGYVYQDLIDSAKLNLISLGRTKMDPMRYYYRTASFLQGETQKVSWDGWVPIDIQIDAKRVYPIYAFGRVFVFWSKSEEQTRRSNDGATLRKQGNSDLKVDSSEDTYYCINIYYSYLDLDNKWITPQLLQGKPNLEIDEQSETNKPNNNTSQNKYTIRSEKRIVDHQIHVELDETVDGDLVGILDYGNIKVGCNYVVFDRQYELREISFSNEFLRIAQLIKEISDGAISVADWLGEVPEMATDVIITPLKKIPDTAESIISSLKDVLTFDIDVPDVVPDLIEDTVEDEINGALNAALYPARAVLDQVLQIISTLEDLLETGEDLLEPLTDIPKEITSIIKVPLENLSRLMDIMLAPRRYPVPIDTYPEINTTFLLNPDSEVRETNRAQVTFPNITVDTFKEICVYDEEYKIHEDDIIVLGRENALTGAYWFAFNHKGGSFLAKPVDERDRSASYDIIRLSAATGTRLSTRLFVGGVDTLLSRRAQEMDEFPKLSSTSHASDTIHYKNDNVRYIPADSHLDFASANGVYYKEIFFHAPYLIAQSLNTAQKFDEAKTWYEYIYDPTEADNCWKYLPFLAEDVQALMDELIAYTDDLPRDTKRQIRSNVEALSGHLKALVPVFQGHRPPSPNDQGFLDYLTRVNQDKDTTTVKQDGDARNPYWIINVLEQTPKGLNKTEAAKRKLLEVLEVIGELPIKWSLLRTNIDSQLKAYLDDPFDPHAIARLRPLAYRKALVMAYVDNLLDWGDMLFRKYTRESINESRMLYILAYDLLGSKPDNMGNIALSDDRSYFDGTEGLHNPSGDYDFLMGLSGVDVDLSISGQATTEQTSSGSFSIEDLPPSVGTHLSIAKNPYFFVPENHMFIEYWDRVEDRLYKIRHSLNILGVKQPLPLFQPPIDPMALVRAVAGGMPLSSAIPGLSGPVPFYRYTAMRDKAKELSDMVIEFGNALQAVLESKDNEALAILQNRQEGIIMNMNRSIKLAQLNDAVINTQVLEETLLSAEDRLAHFEGLIEAGFNSFELVQMGLLALGGGMMATSGILKVTATIMAAAGETHVGPFIAGASIKASEVVEKAAESLETGGDAISTLAEIPGMLANMERMIEDWELEVINATGEIKQLNLQVEAARIQEQVAQYEIDVIDKEMEQNKANAEFLRDKFTNKQLYQWMTSKLSSLHHQSFKLAFDTAQKAQKAFVFERGIKESEVDFIDPFLWDGQRKGLLAGESLKLALARMDQAFVETDARRLEISKPISLQELNPLAWLELKYKGACEFKLDEALFDYDFPGHYCRQIKSVSISFDIELGLHYTLFATLTQLSHHTLMEPDAKAVKYLMEPKNQPPASIRSDWRSGQQIAISRIEEDNGILDPYPDNERYVHFEGTGAVSRWRLELNGKKGEIDLDLLEDVIIKVEYTALQGGQAFGNAVKSMLKPHPTTFLLDFALTYPDSWEEFLTNEEEEFTVEVSRDMFPHMVGGKITSIYTHLDQFEKGRAEFILNDDEEMSLQHGRLVSPSGLSISSRGLDWTFAFEGEKEQLMNLTLVLGYRASVK